MKRPTNTGDVTLSLDTYLKDNNYFEGEKETNDNQKILALWDSKFKSAIAADIKSKFDSLVIDYMLSKFELVSEDNKCACLFFHQVVISNKTNLEFIKVFIKTLVNLYKTTIYLDNTYATINKWQRKSEKLSVVFNKLKTADKHFGYSNPIALTDLIK